MKKFLASVGTALASYNYFGFLFHLAVCGVVAYFATLTGGGNDPYEFPLTFIAIVAMAALLETYAKKPAPPAPRCYCSCGPEQ